MILFAVLVFIFLLGLLVFVHEFGHFVMAKRAGMKVEEFGFGFPPRLVGVRRGETIYSINLIPLGGFVKILGEDGGAEAADEPRAFGNKSFSSRAKVLLAGVVMNFILGWFLLFLGFSVIGTPTELAEGFDFSQARVSRAEIAVVAVEQGSPAEYAGFKPGDVILAVDGKTIQEPSELVDYGKTRIGQNVVFELRRGKEILVREVTPRTPVREGGGLIGFAPAKIGIVSYPLPEALKFSVYAFFSKATLIVRAFGGLLANLFQTGELVEGIAGPVGIAVLVRDFTRLGAIYLVQFTAVLSINLGVINAFPFPALDGGRLLFLIIEKIRGAKSLKWERIANVVGFVLLILLMVAVTNRDIVRLSEQFKRLFERIL